MDNSMPWYGTVLISFFSAGLGALFAWLGIQLQLKHDREKDRRQWSRQVRSEPLLALREKIANIGELYYRYIEVLTVSAFYDNLLNEFLPDNLEESERQEAKDYATAFLDFDNKIQTTIKDITALWQSGEIQRSIYKLDDLELIGQVKQLSKLFNKSIKFLTGVLIQLSKLRNENVDAITLDKYLKASDTTIEEQLNEFNAIIFKIQRLINLRLQNL
jgi:hypothetical protein